MADLAEEAGDWIELYNDGPEVVDLFDNERGICVPGKLYDEGGFGGDFYGRPHANYFQRGADWERAAHFEFFEDDARVAAGNLFVRQR